MKIDIIKIFKEQMYKTECIKPGLPPGNVKIRGNLSTAENFVPQKIFFKKLTSKFFFKSAKFPRIRERVPALL